MFARCSVAYMQFAHSSHYTYTLFAYSSYSTLTSSACCSSSTFCTSTLFTGNSSNTLTLISYRGSGSSKAVPGRFITFTKFARSSSGTSLLFIYVLIYISSDPSTPVACGSSSISGTYTLCAGGSSSTYTLISTAVAGCSVTSSSTSNTSTVFIYGSSSTS